MIDVLVVGAGKIGAAIACLLSSRHYQVHLVDLDFQSVDALRVLKAFPQIKKVNLDATNTSSIEKYLKQSQCAALISCQPYFNNLHAAKAAKAACVAYFDLTEDTQITQDIHHLASHAKSAFVPQCGLAPGFVNIVAYDLINQFEGVHHAKLRVGALPQRSSNGLHYSLTWSTEGLINEYSNLCFALVDGKKSTLRALEGLEHIQLDGCLYEAFNTSGGSGNLIDSCKKKVKSLDYKTLRYPGHCDKMKFLMHELNLNANRPLLKQMLEHTLPKTYEDVVVIYVSVTGLKQGEFIEKSYYKKIYPQQISGLQWSAIQLCSAAGVCGVLDLALQAPEKYHGFIGQEQFSLAEFLATPFGHYYE